jgi:xanthine dehydrogenase large subunit
VLKKGIALTPVKFGISFTLTHLNQAGALVHVYQDGSIHMNHGGTEMGQGLFQKVAQVAAEPVRRAAGPVKITATDTGKVPNTSATAASSGSDLNGMAVRPPATDPRPDRRGRGRSCRPTREVRFEDGHGARGRREMPSPRPCARRLHGARQPVGDRVLQDAEDRLGPDRRPGAAVLLLRLWRGGDRGGDRHADRRNRILRADILHDCGASLNPALDIGQIEGGFVQGAGWLTTEELVWDDNGRLRTHAPSTYKIPACSDRPDIFNVALWDGENREETIYRSKAVGEPPLMLGMPRRWANAAAAR